MNPQSLPRHREESKNIKLGDLIEKQCYTIEYNFAKKGKFSVFISAVEINGPKNV